VSSDHQLLFGYDDGHRLLAGSRELAADTLVALLGATDAAMSADSAPLVTGLALPASDEYVFCVTWSAPEVPRKGAVWGHALIFDAAALADAGHSEALLALPRRPSAQQLDLSYYRAPLQLDSPARGDVQAHLAPHQHDRELLEQIVGAAYRADSDGILVHQDLGAAARALLALWRGQWPALRSVFSFRTRETVRRGPSEFDLTVAAKVRGPEEAPPAPSSAAPSAWIEALTDDLLADGATPLRDFLWAFGPAEPPDHHGLRLLAKLWVRVAAGDELRVRTYIERHWPQPSDGAALKQSLFGGAENRWWRLDERTRVRTLLHGANSAWDLDELELRHRARALALE
jgi:hypothetical protein